MICVQSRHGPHNDKSAIAHWWEFTPWHHNSMTYRLTPGDPPKSPSIVATTPPSIQLKNHSANNKTPSADTVTATSWRRFCFPKKAGPLNSHPDDQLGRGSSVGQLGQLGSCQRWKLTLLAFSEKCWGFLWGEISNQLAELLVVFTASKKGSFDNFWIQIQYILKEHGKERWSSDSNCDRNHDSSNPSPWKNQGLHCSLDRGFLCKRVLYTGTALYSDDFEHRKRGELRVYSHECKAHVVSFECG